MNVQSSPAKEKKKPGRKAETPLQKLQRLEQETALARRAVSEAEQQKFAAIGSAIVAEAEDNPEFMATLRRVLRERITSKAGKAAIASLLDHS